MTRILVVDDEARVCSFIARALTARGEQVDCAPNAATAIQLVGERRYGVVILDLILPDQSGHEVLLQLLDHDPALRVIVLSAQTDSETRVRSLRLGAVDFVPKPFSIAELTERIKLRTEDVGATATSRWLDAGGVRLDRERRVLRSGSKVVELSPREFVLMQHLMQHPNEVCTRSELLDTVWGYSFDPGSNVVDVCVRRLRAKLERQLIETVRNVGYCFTAG